MTRPARKKGLTDQFRPDDRRLRAMKHNSPSNGEIEAMRVELLAARRRERAAPKRIAAALFQDGTGKRCERLALEYLNGPKYSTPGWCQRAVEDQIRKALRASAKGRNP